MAGTTRKKVSVKKQKKEELNESSSSARDMFVVEHSNESKQTGKSKKKKLNVEVQEAIPSCSKATKEVKKALNTTVNIQENEEMVTMEVEGMDVEFTDEVESQSEEILPNQRSQKVNSKMRGFMMVTTTQHS